ncbi:Transporter [Perkinsela sp. CCAP 1560/4]|nr:Transporter [Perkinsela sp. CCAP 1560/4]|eukprot:KNH06178.1 Transporter [Perkinsela sp. CCAP 1560/4]
MSQKGREKSDKKNARVLSFNNWVPRWVRRSSTEEPSSDGLSSPDSSLPGEPLLQPQQNTADELAAIDLCVSPLISAMNQVCPPVTQSKRALEDSSFDLVSPDGHITWYRRVNRQRILAEVSIQEISPRFIGWFDENPTDTIVFHMKSTLSQLGVDSKLCDLQLKEATLEAKCEIEISAITTLGILTLDFLEVGAAIGKLFKGCSARRVHHIPYITRLLGHNDRFGNPLLVYGDGSTDWRLTEIDGRVVAFIKLEPGSLVYDFDVTGFLPTVGKALQSNHTLSLVKRILRLHQHYKQENSRYVREGEMLMVRTKAMQMRSLFGRVVPELLPPGVKCTSSCILEPYDQGTMDNNVGRAFVFYGHSDVELEYIPLEFYTVEPYREGIAFEDRKDLADLLMDYEGAAQAFRSVPNDPDIQACVYICKASQMRELNEESWITSKPHRVPFVGSFEPSQQRVLAQQYLMQQCQFGLLSAIDSGEIISQGVLLTKYFISPILKHLLLSGSVCQYVRAIYFLQASKTTGTFFSQTDRAMLQDLMYFGVRVYHVDLKAEKIHQYAHRMGTDAGMFVPLGRKEEYLHAVYVGIYGSNLIEGDFESDLTLLLDGMRNLLKPDKKDLCVVTGGGPGIMELGNRVANKLGILSCGLFVDFGSGSSKPGVVINEQKKNPYVDAWMTYRLEKLVERQSDFNLDFPIFCVGGVGTDFEFALEEVRRKVGTTPPNPILLFGSKEHWKNKLTARWQENVRSGVVKGSEWLSNVCYVVSSGKQALEVYKKFFNNELAIGNKHPWNTDGFIDADTITNEL